MRNPLTYLLTPRDEQGSLGWGLKGAWVAILADRHARAGLVAVRFLQGGWCLAPV